MATLDPYEAATIANGRWADTAPSSPLTSFAIDTRKIEPGETFVALKSDRQDGHSFLRKAYEYRAVAALVEHADNNIPIPQLVVRDSLSALQTLAHSWRQRFSSPVIGITGSNGKTTVKEMLGKVLGSQWFHTKGNYNNHIGVPLSLLELDNRRHAGAILEAGISDVGEMQLLANLIKPDLAVITSVGPAHIEKLGDVHGVAREKAVLAQSVRAGGTVVIPLSLLQYEPFRELPEYIEVHAIAIDGELLLEGIQVPENVTIYHYNWTENANSRGMGELQTQLPMSPGKFTFNAGSNGMVSNLALVVHVGLQLGVPANTVQACIDEWRPFHQRGEIIKKGKASIYLDCYNANPDSMFDSVQRFARIFPGQPHLYVIGSMNELGSKSAYWHQQTAQNLDIQENAHVYVVGPYAGDLKAGLEIQGIQRERIHEASDPDELRSRISAFAGAVFLKGSRNLGLENLINGGESSC